MEWIHQKNLRNKELKLFETDRYLFRTGCIVCSPPSYPRQPTNKQKVTSIHGFYQHPNSSQEM
jgi:hypothetical protein